MSVIEAVREFIKGCPFLDEFRQGLGVDYLGEDATCYMIESVPAEPIVKRYVDGSSKRQFIFHFSSREPYGPDVLQNIDNLEFYENFADWLDEQTQNGRLLVLDERKTATEIVATSSGYVFAAEEDKARYVIQCRLEYIQR